MPAIDRCLVLAAPPAAPGARALLDQILAEEGPAALLLTGAGLTWAEDPALARAGAAGAAQVAVCTQSAREAGWTPQTSPPWIGWSSVGVWLLQRGEAGRVWSVLP